MTPFGWAVAAFAADPAGCVPPPALVRDRWPLVADGRNLVGEAPLAPVGAVVWPAPWTRAGRGFVEVARGSRLEAAVTVNGAWALEGWFDADAADGAELLRVDGVGGWLSVRRVGGELVLADAQGRTVAAPAPGAEGRVGLGVDHGAVWLLVGGARYDADWAPDAEVLPVGDVRVRVGPGDGRVAVRDLVLHGAPAEASEAAPWCVPSAMRAVPAVEASFLDPKLSFAGYFLGWLGKVPGNDWVARQRLLLEPTVHLSRHTRVTVAVRALDARSVDRTGSTLLPVPRAVSALGEYGVVIEHAYLARWVGEWRLFPFYFVAGRTPLTFGLGLDDRHPLATLSPPPSSAMALLDGDPSAQRIDTGVQFGDTTFPSTLDGPTFFFGPPPARPGDEDDGAQRRLLVGLRGGRHNPWCAGRSAPTCPDVFVPTYEFGLTGVLEQHLNAAPATAADGLVVQLDGGVRLSPEAEPGGFVRAAVSFEPPRDDLVWVAFSAEGFGSTPVRPTGDDPAAWPAPQFAGEVVGAAGRLDLALRPLAFAAFTVEGGGTGRLGLVEGAPLRGLHPDYNADLVLFSQLVAEGTATADPTAVVPSFGGVVNAGFGRAGVTIRVGNRSGVEVPLFFAGATSLGPIPGVMDRGWLGSEFDTALRLISGRWRLAADWGVLVGRGPGLDPLAIDRRHPWSLEGRIGREL